MFAACRATWSTEIDGDRGQQGSDSEIMVCAASAGVRWFVKSRVTLACGLGHGTRWGLRSSVVDSRWLEAVAHPAYTRRVQHRPLGAGIVERSCTYVLMFLHVDIF